MIIKAILKFLRDFTVKIRRHLILIKSSLKIDFH